MVNIMGKHRNRQKILADILSVINRSNNVKKTRIMYDAYLSYELLVRYLSDLIMAKLVILENGNCYSLTTKGKNFLAKYSEYARIQDIVEKQKKHIENQK